MSVYFDYGVLGNGRTRRSVMRLVLVTLLMGMSAFGCNGTTEEPVFTIKTLERVSPTTWQVAFSYGEVCDTLFVPSMMTENEIEAIVSDYPEEHARTIRMYISGEILVQ